MGPPHRPPHRVEGGTPSPPVVLCPGFRAVVWAPPPAPPQGGGGGPPSPPVVLCPGFRAVVWAPPPAPHRVEGGTSLHPCGAMSGVSCSGLGPPTGPPTGWRGGP